MFERAGRVRATLKQEVFDLTLDDTDALFAEHGDNGGDIARGARRGLIGERQERVTCENRIRLAVLRPDRRLATAERVVVHRRQIVMDERVVVKQFDRGGRIGRVFGLSAHRHGRCETDQRTDSLAPRPDGVAHRFGQHGGTFIRPRQDLVQRPFNDLKIAFHETPSPPYGARHPAYRRLHRP